MKGPAATQPLIFRKPSLAAQIVNRKPAKSVELTAPVCQDNPRALITPGIYDAYCVNFELCEVRRYKRISLRLDFRLLAEPDVQVSRFVNMGQDKAMKRRASTDFYRLWTLFNGDLPKCGQQMSLEIFSGKFCKVRVDAVTKDSKGNELPQVLRYSVVRDVLEVWEA